MGRPPNDPSGAGITVTIRLSPARMHRLDELVDRLEISRSAVIAKLLDRAAPKEPT